MPIRLGVVAASPVYYQTPLYRQLATDPRLDVTVIFCSDVGLQSADIGFGHPVAWDVDPLVGFRSVFLKHAATRGPAGKFFALRDIDVVGQVRRGDFDVLWLHGYYSLTHLLAAITQRLRRRPIFVREEQNLLQPRPRWKRGMKRLLFRTVFGRAYALTIGVENARWFRAQGVAEQRMFRVPYAVDNDRFQSESRLLRPRRVELRRELSIPADTGPVFLTVARLEPRKQPHFLLEAFRLAREAQRCTLLVVGSGPLEGELRSEVARRGIPDVVFAGFRNQSEVGRAYACADVFLLPSASETWGVTVNEAMNFGLPVVVSDRVGCARDLVRDGENGFVVNADDPEELADRIRLLAESIELREWLGARALDVVSKCTYATAAAGARIAIETALADRWLGTRPVRGTA